MNRDELLTKLAMELGEWPKNADHAARALPPICGMRFPSREVTCRKHGIAHELGNLITNEDYLHRRAELINKPSWGDAPEWAQWLAQDKRGEWCFYPARPEQSDDMWINDEPKTGIWVDVHCRGKTPAGHNWRDTLEKRPTTACMDCGATNGIHDTNCATHERHDRATIIDEMARTVDPMEWRGSGHMRYAGHTITWGEYVTRRHEIEDEEEWPEDRADAIGQNGPTGDHYDYAKAPCGADSSACFFNPCDECPDDYAEDSDIESPLSRATQELNPATSSLTHSQAEDAARETGICSDGSPCGRPHNPDDDQYCSGCPNEPVAHDCPRCGGEWWSPPHEYCPCMDAGAHYRREYKGVKLDPYRIAKVYDMQGGPREQIMKKCLRFIEKGQTEREVVNEIRTALVRWEEMLEEDGQ